MKDETKEVLSELLVKFGKLEGRFEGLRDAISIKFAEFEKMLIRLEIRFEERGKLEKVRDK